MKINFEKSLRRYDVKSLSSYKIIKFKKRLAKNILVV